MSGTELGTRTAVPRKKHGPRRSFAARKTDARRWLEELVPPEKVTDERVAELAAFVDRYAPGSRYRRIADAMIRNNETPTYEKVTARYLSRKNAWLRRNGEIEPVDLTPAVVERLAGIIDTSWKDRGQGPSWTEVRTAMGWDHRQTHEALHRLRPAGTIGFTTETGSLAWPGPASRSDGRPDGLTPSAGARGRQRGWSSSRRGCRVGGRRRARTSARRPWERDGIAR